MVGGNVSGPRLFGYVEGNVSRRMYRGMCVTRTETVTASDQILNINKIIFSKVRNALHL